jgi:hypothetical protein
MKRWLSLPLAAIAVAFASCSTAPKPLAGSLSIPGVYTMIAGGFNESLVVEMKQDATYSMDHELFACDLSGITYNREEGVWRVVDGLVLLEPKARTKGFPDAPVFAPAAFRRLLPKQDGEKFYLVHPDCPTRCVLQKGRLSDFVFPFQKAKKIPANKQELQPPAADAPVASPPGAADR